MPLASFDKIVQLRQLLAERFGLVNFPSKTIHFIGLPALDDIGIPQAAVTEIVSSITSGPGGSLLLYGLLHASLQKGDRVALLDGRDGFAPKGLPQADLKRLLWIRCHEAWEAIKAADLTIRDGNLPLIVLLLTQNSPAELRRIPATTWHRLQILAEKSAVTVLVFSPHAQVNGAWLRISVSGAFPLSKLHHGRAKLLPALSLQIERQRVNRERRNEGEDVCRPACA